MKDKLRELADRLDVLSTAAAECRWSEFSMRIPAEPKRDADLVMASAAVELRAYAATLDAESDGGAVAVQTRYQGPNKTVNTDWRPCSFAHAQAVKDARCDVTEIRYLYTNPARSGVVSEEDVQAACEKYNDVYEGEIILGALYATDNGKQAMRAALESYERSRK